MGAGASLTPEHRRQVQQVFFAYVRASEKGPISDDALVALLLEHVPTLSGTPPPETVRALRLQFDEAKREIHGESGGGAAAAAADSADDAAPPPPSLQRLASWADSKPTNLQVRPCAWLGLEIGRAATAVVRPCVASNCCALCFARRRATMTAVV